MTPAVETLTQDDTERIERLLLGRRIVTAETGEFTRPNDPDSWDTAPATGRLTLDDGTQVFVAPHQGCVCSAGDYELTHLASVDNVITAVRVVAEDQSGVDEYDEPDTHYRIFVVADAVTDAVEINAVTIEGSDGNGYYGTGYELIVVAP